MQWQRWARTSSTFLKAFAADFDTQLIGDSLEPIAVGMPRAQSRP